MFFKNIEVSGIDTVVIDRNLVWRKFYKSAEWYLKDHNTANHKPGHAMMKMIGSMLASGKYRAWVHDDTLNIVRINEGVKANAPA